MSVTREKIFSTIKKIAESEGFAKFEHSFSAGSKKGDNFIGEITRVKISGQKTSGKNGNLDLIIKCGASSAKRRQEFRNDLIFDRETYFYTVFAPIFEKFQRDCGLVPDLTFSSYPKCFDSVCNTETEEYMLVFEDLCARGYEMWPKSLPNPVGNTRMVVRALAKLHAVSFAMKDQQPTLFEPFKKLNDLMSVFIESGNTRKMFEASYDRTIAVLDDPVHIEIYSHLKDHLEKYMEDLFGKEKRGRFSVIGHGDCWNNNILYHKTKLNAADNISLLDWQILRYCSPAFDLLYHIFTATDAKTRKKEFQSLIKIYYDQLSLNIRSMGSDPEKLFTFDDLQSELKRCGNYALMMTPILLQISLAKSDDIPDLNDMCDQAEKYDLIQSSDSEFDAAFKLRISETIDDLIGLGYCRKVGA